MDKILLKCINEKTKAAMDVYDAAGSILLRNGTIITPEIKSGLESAGIAFVYAEDNETKVSGVFPSMYLAELMRILKNFISSGGENGEILKRYNKEEIRKFIGKDNNAGNAIAFGHIFKYFSMKMAESLEKNVKWVFDYLDFRAVQTYSNFHAINSACIAGILAHNMGLKKAEVADIITGVLFCDIKMSLFSFTERPEALTPAETEEMRQHTRLSYDAVRKIYGIPARSALISLQHHERCNAGGYPVGIKGKDISLGGKIAAIADVYDSMLSVRPYRPAFSPQAAWEYINSNKSILFDETTAKEFALSIPKFMPGDIVEIEGGTMAQVVENVYGYPENPSIKIIEKKGKSVIIPCGDRSRNIIKTLETIRQKEK
jgi:HD-GYP domain-containing protein (c-di-GMP phosphodiesterase class II)